MFNGTLEITGNVLVGETAKIEADLHAQNISIAGMVRGNVSGNKVQLLRTARVWGDITAAILTTEEGAFIDGKISMPEVPPAPVEETPVPEEVVGAVDEPFFVPDEVPEEVLPEVVVDEMTSDVEERPESEAVPEAEDILEVEDAIGDEDDVADEDEGDDEGEGDDEDEVVDEDEVDDD